MPTYDYQCDTCGVCFELFQSFSEDSLKKCPTRKSGNSPDGCTSVGRGKVHKVFSAPGIAFKGSGFYKNDSRSGSSSNSSTTVADKPTSDTKTSDSSGSEKTKTTSTSDSGSSKSNTKSTTSSKSS